MIRERTGAPEILLIQRKKPPFQGAWALPGGFLDSDEDAITAARRELKEETGLGAKNLVEIGSYSDPRRDSRGRVITIAFYSVHRSRVNQGKAADDAANLRWFSTKKLPTLAFDHARIIRDGLKKYFAQFQSQ